MHQSDTPTPRTVRSSTANAPARVTRQVKRVAARADRRNVAAAIALAVAELHASTGEEVTA